MIETMGVHSGWDELPDIELFERVLPCKTVLAPGGSTTRETIVLPALAECLSHAQLLTVNVQAYESTTCASSPSTVWPVPPIATT